jgi:arylsulfatase A-like enzyme
VRYARAVSPSPLCAPARASLLIGLNAIKNGVLTNDQWLRPDREACGVRTWPELLTAAGYRTAAIGKMHFYPWDASEGFAERVITEDKRHVRIEDDYFHYLQQHASSRLAGSPDQVVIRGRPSGRPLDKWWAMRLSAPLAPTPPPPGPTPSGDRGRITTRSGDPTSCTSIARDRGKLAMLVR